MAESQSRLKPARRRQHPSSPPGQPERIIKAIHHPNKDAATSLLFSWTDTKETRPARSAMYAILNHTERQPNVDVLTALQHYDVQTVAWTKRQDYAAKLAA